MPQLLMLDSVIGELVASLFEITFKFFGIKIELGNLYQSIGNMIKLGFTNTGDFSTIWGLGTNLYNILKPVALSLLVLFFMMDMFTLFRDINGFTTERVIMKAIKGIAVYMVIGQLPGLLTSIISITSNIFTSVSNINIDKTIAATSLSDSIQTAFNDMDLIEEMLAAVVMIFMFSAYIGSAVAAIVSVFQRFFKLMLLYGLAPVPVCLMTFEQTSQAGKRFFQTFIATLLEAVLIYLLLEVYKLGLSNLGAIGTDGIKDVISFGVTISIYNALLTGGISLCSHVMQEVVGGVAF